MPEDFLIKTGDMIQFTIPPPTVVPTMLAPIPLLGSSSDVKINGVAACIEGDEMPKVLMAPQPYTAPPYVTPGVLKVEVKILPANKTVKTKDKGKALLLKGQTFQVELTVIAPAMQPTPGGPVPDGQAKKQGTAQFITTNFTVKAS